MSSPETIAMNFWYSLDYFTNPGLGKVSSEVLDAERSIKKFLFGSPLYKPLPTPENMSEENLKKTRDIASRDPKLIDEMGKLVKLTLDVMSQSQHFGNDLQDHKSLELQEIAFIHFGQGTLYDNLINPKTGQMRRPKEAMIHMMDGKSDFYYLWHFVLSQNMLNSNLIDDPVLFQLNRYIGLAAEIDFILEPHQSDNPPGVKPKNHSIDADALSRLKSKWLGNADFVETGEHMRLLMQRFRERLKEREE